MISNVAVLGGGNGGHAAAADLTLAGFDVNFFDHPNYVGSSFKRVMETGEVEIVGKATAKLKRVTTSIREALEGVELVLVIVPSFGHRTLADTIAEYMRRSPSRPPIVLTASNAGTLEFRKIFKERGIDVPPLAETSTLPYGCRISEPGKVLVHVTAKLLPTGVYPAERTDEILDRLRQLYDRAVPAKNVMEAALNNPNPITHPAATLLNVGRIEYAKGEFYLYKEGITRSTAKIYDALCRERGSILEVLDFRTYECGEQLTEMDRIIQMGLLYGAGSWKVGALMKGPSDVKDRYVTEDVPYGLVLWASLADMFKIEVPVMKSIITLFSTINQEDYFVKGRTVEKLGIGGLSPQELNELLTEGF